uniref:CP4B1 protein n=1 Tax=Otus sunia TaxID=257818 RepID=A0A8C8AXE4_9STRI
MASLLDNIVRPSAVVLQLSVVLGIIFVLLKVVQFYQERKKLIKALEAFPGPPKHWLYGHNHLVRRELSSIRIVSWGEEYPYAFPRWFGPVLPSLIIHHPEYAKSILGRTGKSLHLLVTPLLFVSPGQGLLILNGTKWFQHRKLLTPAFHYDVLKSYVDLMSDSVKVMLDKWEKKNTEKSVELFQDVSLMTLDSIMKCAFSYNTNCQTQRSALELSNSGKAKGTWQDTEEETPGFSGHSSFGSATQSPLLPLKHSLTPQFAFREDLGKMTYTTMCIKESLRLFPPVPAVSRCLSKSVTFSDGRSLPAGLLSLPLLLPQVYDPLRFSPENSAQRHSHAFLPFSAGSRNCIGQQFAMNEMKVALALTLLRFKLCPDPSKPPRLLPQLILRSSNGIHLHLRKIH